MPTYRYKARDKSGMPITGVTDAESKKILSYGLKELGYQVVSIEEERGFKIFFDKFIEQYKIISRQEVILFYRQMGVMLKSGLPLMSALSSMAQQTKNPKFKRVIVDIIEDIKAGKSMSAAMQKYPKVFSGFNIGMVRAGETGGMLGQSMERLAALGMEELELKGRITSALAYPVMLVFVAVGIVLFLIVGILPKFITIFKESGAELPLPTVLLLGMSTFLKTFWFIPVLLIVGAVFAMRFYMKTFRGKYRIHGILLKIPLFGDLTLKMIIAQFARTLGSLTKSGVPILYAMGIVQDVVKNVVVARAIENIRGAITEGERLSEPFRLSGVFPNIVCQMIAAGEKTGTIDDMLINIGDYYDQEIGHTIRTVTSLLEPLLMLTMGLVVGFIALSVLLPIFNLIKVFKS